MLRGAWNSYILESSLHIYILCWTKRLLIVTFCVFFLYFMDIVPLELERNNVMDIGLQPSL